MTAQEVLKKYWGFSAFREMQAEIIQSVLDGEDTLALLPTGGGKSICYQVPGLVRNGICVVVSPLIALMQDQVKNLQKKGIKAAALTSGMTNREIDIVLDNAKFGGLDFLYVSPERLKTDLFLTRFAQMKLALIAVDEAHCVSQWGHDFRPPYLEIFKLREIHPLVPILAVTATATKKVQEDIVEHLQLKKIKYFEGSFLRPNISYEVYAVENKRKAILKSCEKFKGASGIIYCQTRRETKELTKLLLAHKFSAGVYHGGMDGDERKEKLTLWMQDHIKIMVATNAFGMGIDKPDVRFVLHYELPNNLEAYFQEAGRSGRDGKASRNLAFYTNEDLAKMKKRIAQRFPPIDYIKTVYRALCNHLSIAIGSGEGESYGLSIASFINKYNLEAIPTYNALKILELNGTLLFNEAAFHATKFKFIVTNKTLYEFQIKYPKLDNVISLISRRYNAAFTSFVEIKEIQIAKLLHTSTNEVVAALKTLEKHGLVSISWQTNLPQVTLLHERLPDDYMRIDQSVYDLRKEVEIDKLNKLLSFIEKPKCRSVSLLNYFGQSGAPCGICDVCLAAKKSNYTGKEATLILKSLLQEKEYTLDELIEQMGEVDRSSIVGILNWLIEENLIFFKDGYFGLIKK